jgi:hypothetical protein
VGGNAREPGARAAGAGARECAPRVGARQSAIRCLDLLRPGCRWVWEAGSGLCGGYVRWIKPLGVLGDMSVESGPGWSGVGWVKWKGRGSGMGGWEMGDWRGSGMGGEGFQAKRDGHRAPRGGWPVWLEIPIYIPGPPANLYRGRSLLRSWRSRTQPASLLKPGSSPGSPASPAP